MGLESATFISELDNSFPLGGDPINKGDDHIRLIKAVLQTQFPNFTAAAANMTVAELNVLVGILASTAELNILNGATLSTAELNFVDGVTSLIQTQLDDISAAKAPNAHSHTGSEISDLDTADTTTGTFDANRIPTHTGDVTGQTALTIASSVVGRSQIANSTTTSAGTLAQNVNGFTLNNWALFPMIHTNNNTSIIIVGHNSDGGSASSPRFGISTVTAGITYDVDHRWITA